MIALALDGVLRGPTGTPILDGVRLYGSLTGKIVVLADVHTVEAEHWLKSNGLTSHDDTLGNEMALGEMDLRVRQVEHLRVNSSGLIVVEPDADRALKLVEMGVTTLLFSAQRFTLPSQRLDRAKAKTWMEIQKEAAERQSLPFKEYE